MKRYLTSFKLVFLFVLMVGALVAKGQTVPITGFSINPFGQAEIEIDATSDKYYILSAVHPPTLNYESVLSMTLGVDGRLTITSPGAAFSQQNYIVTAYSIADPADTDGDGFDDIEEFNDMPRLAPLNFAPAVPFFDGTTSVDNHETFSALSVIEDDIPWAPFLNNQEFAKFAIVNHDSDNPEVYFINTNTHDIHASFLWTIDDPANVVTGEIIFNPNNILPNGQIGSYMFNYSFGDAATFERTQRTFELLIANMPYLGNNMQHFIGSGGEAVHQSQYKDDFEGSRIEVVLESDFFSDIDFIPFNETEGFGYFRQMDLDEVPNSRDIVLYDALPNSLPRVGGIITSVVQTPLSHVNLRAIQDNVPNAYIRNPLEIDSIAQLLDNYIYYRVESDKYFIREASLDEVNAWFEKLRPTQEQIPDRDLSIKRILPLDSIDFYMSTSFGAKCSNVATMRTFGFPEGTIPNGFGVPFYFYDEFMKFNNFYDEVASMLSNPEFVNDLDTRIDMLKDFRRDIKDADMPQWMLDELEEMHNSFPDGTSIRCRSSTNNEDLPGFSGAGLYTSKTQHPDEGHMSKSIKQVYASMWNFRAFEERDFYRVDHFIAAMGVLCHPNYKDEKSNGVGVSIDPVYGTDSTFYLNTQVGEDLVTNPEANSIPEEILLYQNPEEGYFLLRESNLTPVGALVMDDIYLDQMREYLQVIHDEFAILYDLVGVDDFGMDIEYKVTSEDQLIIKQARPWVSFWADIKAASDIAALDITEPSSSANLGDSELVSVLVSNQGLKPMYDFDLSLLVDGDIQETIFVTDTISPQNEKTFQFQTPQNFDQVGAYAIKAIVAHPQDGHALNDTIDVVLSKLHLIEGGLVSGNAAATCGNEVSVSASLSNLGESIINSAEIETVVNGVVVDTVTFNINIPYTLSRVLELNVTQNLTTIDNEITLNILKINGEDDGDLSNNSITVFTDLESDHDFINLIINPDNFPEETSWSVYDELSEEIIAAGELQSGTNFLNEEICVDYSSCLSVTLTDVYGDGICCSFGIGNFLVVNNEGDTLAINDGNFGFEGVELFCPSGEGCLFDAELNVVNATTENDDDGVIDISASDGFGPYQFSIDGGNTFTDLSTFSNLAPGTYEVVVTDASQTCFYEELVEVGFEILSSNDEVLTRPIKVYPNPTEDIIVVELNDAFEGLQDYELEVYNAVGQLLWNQRIGSHQRVLKIDLDKWGSGHYIIECHNKEARFIERIVKL